MASPRVNVWMASRNCRMPDWAVPSWMNRSTLRGSVARACSARAIPPVSGCDRYSTPAGERYCTDWPAAGAETPATAATRTAATRTVARLRVRGIVSFLGIPGCWGTRAKLRLHTNMQPRRGFRAIVPDGRDRASLYVPTSPEALMTDRRAFVSTMLSAGIGYPVLHSHAVRRLAAASTIAGSRAPLAVAEDEAYWGEIRRAFTLDDTLINLNNGWCSPAPAHALEQMIRDIRFSNELPVEHMARLLEPRIEGVREGLAKDFGCDTEEMAITRNASEANETMIFGLDLKRGDEVIVTTQNYGRMVTAWKQ